MKDNFIAYDQGIMSNADNYRKYLYLLLKPYIKGHILEIGAGIGNLTEEVTINDNNQIKSITCIEEDIDCYKNLRSKFSTSDLELNFILGHFPHVKPASKQFDLIFSFNVLEHIDDDVQAIKECYNLLSPGGVLFAFVPAFQCLYGSMDHKLKHYRRYSKKGIIEKTKLAGFCIEKIRYCNFIGFLGWYFNNRILKIESQKPNQVAFFDKIILPVQSKIEKYIEPCVGQNLYIAARKIS